MPQVERLFRAMEPTQVGLDRDHILHLYATPVLRM